MIRMVMLTTDWDEETLFLKLVSRGRHANIPYYYSVETYDWALGIVEFTQLDRRQSPNFKVAVAGNMLIVSKTYLSEITGWLPELNITVTSSREKAVSSGEGARSLVKELRRTHAGSRTVVTHDRVRRVIAHMNRATDRDLLRK